MDHFYRSFDKYDEKASLENARKRGYITRDDESLIWEYLHEKQARDHIQYQRSRKISSLLVNFRKFMPVQFRDAQITDIYAGITDIQNGTNNKGKRYSQNSIHDFIVALKGFYVWMIENGYSTIPEKKLRKISAPPVNRHTKHPDEILTHEEIDKLIESCEYPRDKAIIGTLYETGCRIAELSRLVWRDIKIDEYGAKILIREDRKGLKPRYARMTTYAKYLAVWREHSDGEPDDPVFTLRSSNEPLTYIAIMKLLQRLKARSGITKRIHPHLFRHSRITHMIAENWQESVVKKTMWNNLATTMFQTYVTLSENDIDAEALDRANLEKKEKKQKGHLPRPCPNCHQVNPPTAKYCMNCQWPLTEEGIASTEQLLDWIKSDPEFLAVTIEKFVRMRVQNEIQKARGDEMENKIL